MKMSISQMVLGALIVVSLFLFVEYVRPGYYNEIIIDTDGDVIGHIFGLQKPNVLLDIWSFIYLSLGLAVFACGVVQYVQARRQVTNMVLFVIPVILGALIVVSLIVLIVWAEPEFESYTRLIENGTREVIVQKEPDWIILQASWKAVSYILGLSVLGCGIAQYRRAKRIEDKA